MFVHSKVEGEISELSPPVLSALHAKKMGNTIPKAVIASPDLTQAWGLLNHDELGDSKSYREAKRAVKDIMSGKAEAPASEDPEMMHWGIKGKSSFYKGVFKGVTDKDEVTLKTDMGSTINLPLDQLGGGAASYARNLAGKSKPAEESGTPPVTPEVPVLAIEDWESADGKVIEAKFEAIEGDRIALVDAAGKRFVFPLTRLSEESQTRARELAK